jgi:hypothetical protein
MDIYFFFSPRSQFDGRPTSQYNKTKNCWKVRKDSTEDQKVWRIIE